MLCVILSEAKNPVRVNNSTAHNEILRTVLDGQHLSWTDRPLVLWPRDKGYRVQGRFAPQNDNQERARIQMRLPWETSGES